MSKHTDWETEYKVLLKERDEIRGISHQRKKELDQERFNHTSTRIAWDRTCQKLYDLNSEIEKTRIIITQFAEWASINDWKYYPGDELWRKRWQCQISSNDLYEKFLNHSKDEK